MTKKQNGFVSFLRKNINIVILVIAFVVVLFTLWQMCGPQFMSAANWESMAYQIPEFGLLAMGMMLCMIAGGIDLSIVSTATISSVLAATVMKAVIAAGGSTGGSIVAAVVTALVVSSICGFINGVLIARLHILPILVTLATMILYKGVAMAITGGAGITGYPEEFLAFGRAKLGGVIPVIFIILVVFAVIVWFMLEKTKYGLMLYLYGEDSVVSLFSGINNASVITFTYTISGLLCGVASIIMMARVNSAKVGYGDIYQMQAILVCVIGGVDPNGGKGKVIGVCIAIVLLQMLQSGFTVLGFEPYIKKLIWGTVLVGVMMINYITGRIRKKRFAA